MTIREALNAAKTRLASVSDSAALDAQVLMGTVLQQDRTWLLTHPEQTLTPEQVAAFTAYVDRAAAGEPLPYILGQRAFYDRDLLVTPAVLIPRPETELLLEQALVYVSTQPMTVVDVGVGSGALAVTLAALCPGANVYATDISAAALAVARRNASEQSAQVTFFEGDLVEPLIQRGIRCHLIMANLPYIPTEEVSRLEVSRYEPRLALDGGVDGLVLIRRLLKQIPLVAHDQALILLEIMAGQGEAALAAAHQILPQSSGVVLPDYADHDRIVRIEYRGES